MKRLKREQADRDYATLMHKRNADEDYDPAHDDISPSLVLNILLSVVFCAGGIFHITRYWHNDGLRVLVSLLVGIVVGVAEVTVYAAYLRKVKQSREKEKGMKEKRQFLGEYRGENEGDVRLEQERKAYDEIQSHDKEIEKEEIWGRGVNGGMRRRVREKWERAQKK